VENLQKPPILIVSQLEDPSSPQWLLKPPKTDHTHNHGAHPGPRPEKKLDSGTINPPTRNFVLGNVGGEDSPTADGLVAAFVGIRVLVGSHNGWMFTRVGGAITG